MTITKHIAALKHPEFLWLVEDFRTRPLDGAPYAYVTLDALVVKCREGGRPSTPAS